MRRRENSRDLITLLRVETILSSIEDGLPFPKIQEKLQNLPLNQPELYGLVSVEKTIRSLRKIPFITGIVETVAQSDEDTIEKRDLIINLSGKNIDTIAVQVKSSIYRVLDFYNQINPDYDIAQQILTQRKLIVINGQLPEDIITKFFLDKLTLIDDHYQDCPLSDRHMLVNLQSIRRDLY